MKGEGKGANLLVKKSVKIRSSVGDGTALFWIPGDCVPVYLSQSEARKVCLIKLAWFEIAQTAW